MDHNQVLSAMAMYHVNVAFRKLFRKFDRCLIDLVSGYITLNSCHRELVPGYLRCLVPQRGGIGV